MWVFVTRCGGCVAERALFKALTWACLHRWVFRVGMPSKARIELVEAMADIEHRLAVGTSEKLQLGALVAAFVTARAAIASAAV